MTDLKLKRQKKLLEKIAETGRYKVDKLIADFSVMTGLRRSTVAEYIETLQTAGLIRIVGSFVELVDESALKGYDEAVAPALKAYREAADSVEEEVEK